MANWTLVEAQLSDGFPMRVYVAEHEGKLCGASIGDPVHPVEEDQLFLRWALGFKRQPKTGAACDVLNQAAAEVQEYFAGRRLNFEVPLCLNGTPFQVRVWQQLLRIPFGRTCSYADLAGEIGHPSAFRAVGGANGRNRLPLFVPCHRVLATGGKLGGFTGGIGLKRRLLAHEASVLGFKLV